MSFVIIQLLICGGVLNMEKKYEVLLSSDLIEKFEIATKLCGENSKEVLEKMMMQYISTSFSRMSQEYNPRNKFEAESTNIDYAKAKKRIPKWALKPQQNNHKIIKAFLMIQKDKTIVNLQELEERCSNADEYPETFVRDFRGNFAQMKIDAPKSHGKVFEVEDGIVAIWPEVENVLNDYKTYFM